MLLLETIEIDEDVLLFSFEIAGHCVTCAAHFCRQNEEMRLTKLHLGSSNAQDSARNQVGRAALWRVARELGRYFGVRTLHIEGGRRSTGRFKGQLPSPFIIDIPNL